MTVGCGSENQTTSFEDQLERVGGFGRYQKTCLLFGGLVTVLCLVHNISTIFTVEERDFYCSTSHSQNSSHNFSLSDVISTKNLCPCNGEIVFDPYDSPSAVTKYKLVCENESRRQWPRLSYALGLLLSGSINGFLADTFGRRKAIFTSSIFVTICGVAGPLLPNVFLYSVARFCTAVGVSAFIVIAIVFIAESGNNEARTIQGICLISSWSLGSSFLALFGYLFENFLVFDWVSAICFGVLGLLMSMVVVESPRWQFTRNNAEDYYKGMMYIAKFNGVTLDEKDKILIAISPNTSSQNEDRSELVGEKVSIFDMFVNRYTTITTLLIWFMWLGVSFLCYSMVFHALVGNKCLNLFMGSAIETVLNLSLLCVVNKMPRKLLMVSITSMSALAAILATVINILGKQEVLSEVYFMLTLLSRMMGSLFWGVLGLITAETYPTLLRAQANGSANMLCRFSIVLATFLGTVPQSIVIGIITLVIISLVIASCLVPETRGHNLPGTVSEYAQFCKSYALRAPFFNSKQHDTKPQFQQTDVILLQNNERNNEP